MVIVFVLPDLNSNVVTIAVITVVITVVTIAVVVRLKVSVVASPMASPLTSLSEVLRLISSLKRPSLASKL